MVLGQEREGAHLSEDVASALCEGRYRLTRVLGLGGMATVYLANDSRLGVYRAIKVLSPQLTRSKAIRRRFLSEAQTMARLLQMSPHAINSRFQRMNARLGVPNRRAAAQLAAEYGLI